MEHDDDSAEFDARRYFRVLRQRKWVVLAVAAVVVAVSVGVSLLQTPVYDAAALLLIQDQSASNGSVFSQASQLQNPTLVVQTQMQIITSRPVRDAVAKQLGVGASVVVTDVGQTDVVQVQASSTSPGRAADIANSYATAYIDFTRTQDINTDVAASTQISAKVTDLQKQIDALDAQVASAAETDRATVLANVGPQRDNLVTQQGLFRQRLDQLQVDSSLRTGAAQLVTPAVAPKAPSSPKPARNAVLGLVIGLILGVGGAFALDFFDDSISSVDDLNRIARGLPNLGLIPQVGGWKPDDAPMVVSLVDPGSPAAEAYRTLRTSIQFVGLDRAARIIQFTSPNAEEGKSATVSNLAVALANAGQRVCLCCCDLRRPRVHEFFGLDNSVGLTSAILGELSISLAVQAVPDVRGLFLMASGPQPPNPSELLGSNRALEVIHALGMSYDIVLLDCPPVLPVTDATVVARMVDATVLAVKANSTSTRELTAALDILRQVNAPLIGTVLNGITFHTGGGYYRYHQYYRYERQVSPLRNGSSLETKDPAPAVVGSRDS